jgi:hypothetical protein
MVREKHLLIGQSVIQETSLEVGALVDGYDAPHMTLLRKSFVIREGEEGMRKLFRPYHSST